MFAVLFSSAHAYALQMSRAGPIIIIGSINMDLVCRMPRMPVAGETILGSDFAAIPGGKGANQAVAAARLALRGTEAHFVGRVGSDDFGKQLLSGLKEHGVRTDHVTVTPGASGVAMILVDRGGENSIVVAPGANTRLLPKDIDAARPLIERASVVVMQLEFPLSTVRHAIAMCRRAGVFTILDPAPVPADGLPRALFGVDLLTPNQQEAGLLLGTERLRKAVRRKAIADPKQTAAGLLARGASSVVLKLGSRGAMLVDQSRRIERGRAFKVSVVDTTAAGDAFTGALAVARAEGMSTSQALRFANAAGALACTRLGAQPSLPARDAVEKLIARK
jgi:ribokinase